MARLGIGVASTYKWQAFGAVALGLFAAVSDHGSVTVALPTIADHFGTDLPTAQWVVIGYALTISALLLPMGRLSDLLGRKRVYLVGFGFFVVVALLAGLATSIVGLVLSRLLMGVGAAMTQATGMAIVVSAFPEVERGKALGLQMSAVGTGGVAGPALGGLVVSLVGWRGVFMVTAVMGVVAIVAAYYVLRGREDEEANGRGSGFDWVGAGLSTSVLLVFLVAVTRGSSVGWISAPILLSFALLGVLLTMFLTWELRVREPMLDVRMFAHQGYSMGVAARFISFIGISSVRFLMPFYMQSVLGLTPRQVGAAIVPAAFAMIVTGPLGGRLSDRYGWRPLTTGGLLVSAGGLFIVSRVTDSTPVALLVLAMVVQSCGTGIFGAPNSSSVLSAVDPEAYGVTSGFLNLVRNAGNVTGIAISTAVVTAVMASHGFPPTLAAVSNGDGRLLATFASGTGTAYAAMAVLVLIAAALSAIGGERKSLAANHREAT